MVRNTLSLPRRDYTLELYIIVDAKGFQKAQTPQQRRANEAYARAEAAKRGKPVTDVKRPNKPAKPPISKGWLYLLIFVVMGGLIVELLRIILGFGSGFFS